MHTRSNLAGRISAIVGVNGSCERPCREKRFDTVELRIQVKSPVARYDSDERQVRLRCSGADGSNVRRVKSVTMLRDDVGAFPDARSERATRHVNARTIVPGASVQR
jgi:hypothetical protein